MRTVAAQPMDASSTAKKWPSLSFAMARSSISNVPSKIEIDHFLHHHRADAHPTQGDDRNEPAMVRGEEQTNILWRDRIERPNHDERNGANNRCRGERLHRHRSYFPFHFLAFANRLRQIADRLG